MYNKIVTIKISSETLQEIDRFAEMIGVSRSELIRRALSNMLKSSDINTFKKDHRGSVRKSVVSIDLE